MEKLEIKFNAKQKAAIRQIGVEVIYLFGSYASGKHVHAQSDIDIGVVLADPQKYRYNSMEPYGILYDILIDILPKEYLKERAAKRLHEFDLVFLQYSPLELQYNAVSNSKVLYQRNNKVESDYREKMLNRYIDMNFLLKIRHQAILSRI